MFDCLKLSDDDISSEQITSIIVALNRLMKDRKFNEIDILFNSVDVNNLNSILLLTLIRTTFPIREELSEWDFLLEKIEKVFLNRNLEAHKLLKGLL